MYYCEKIMGSGENWEIERFQIVLIWYMLYVYSILDKINVQNGLPKFVLKICY
jgi:hypothetical protein